MIELFPERELLRTIDPAPRTATEHDRLRNLNTVLQRIAQPRPHRSRTTRRFWMGAALPIALVAGAAAVVYSTLPTPMPPSIFGTAPQQLTQPTPLEPGSTTGEGFTVLASVAVGDSQIYLGQRGDELRFGGAINGGNADSNVSLVQPVASVAADSLVRLDGGNFSDAAAGGLATFLGQIGSEVVGVDIRTFDGDLVMATVIDDMVIAAWEGRDGSEGFTDGQEYVLHLRDGTSKTLTSADLIR